MSTAETKTQESPAVTHGSHAAHPAPAAAPHAHGGQPSHDVAFALPPPAQLTPARARRFVAVGVLIFAGLFSAGFLPRFFAQRALAAETAAEAAAIPRVELITASPLTSDRDLKLPGSVEPLEQTVIYPRAQGYVKKWLVDLGAKVKEGDLLAEIDTPELDAQLEQARAQQAQAEADVVRAEANAGFSKSNLERYKQLTPAGLASQQDLDQHRAQQGVDEAAVTVAKSTVAAQVANVRRLMQLKSFSRVTAPFSGTIVSRTVERGALVAPGVTPLFKLAAVDTVRVMVQVPQDVAPGVQTDKPAKVSVREFPAQPFEGVVAHAAGALDDSARTMMVEVRVPNPDGKLLTGMYAEVALSLPTPHRLFEIPVTALYSDSRGTRVATVGSENRVVMKSVGIERDTGQTLQIATGLDGTEKIIKLANASLTDGSPVEVMAAQKK
jgi:RND family efflux transporter MFP subunit